MIFSSMMQGLLTLFLLRVSSRHPANAFSLGSLSQRTRTDLFVSSSSSTFTTNAVTIDPNTYNVDLETAVDLITCSVQQDKSLMRDAGIPFIDVKSKDYFVDDVDLVVSRVGGMGLELLELAGGRDDGFGITVITKVSGNALKAGVIPGDSIAAVTVRSSSSSTMDQTTTTNTVVQENTRVAGCECLDFDRTMDCLVNFPDDDDAQVILSVKRIRRWPKIKVTVEYPPIQVAEGVDNKIELELFAGENLRRALLNRGIVLEDPQSPKCDFCGTKCTVSVTKGMKLLSPRGMTEAKIMAKNPTCRVSNTQNI
jgi:hypothetical protein